MDSNSVQRVSSGGRRLPGRPGGSRPMRTEAAADGTRSADGEAPSLRRDPDRADPVKQDRVFKELLCSERRGALEWEKKWSFLRNYDQMGHLKSEEPLPSDLSLFSDQVPNTSNQVYGSRLATPLGSELVRLDRLSLGSGSHRKHKQDPELLPH